MKRFNYYFRIFLLSVFVFLTAGLRAQTTDSLGQQMDSVEISLLTCSPGQEIWSLYGHTAIRVYDPVHQQDFVINYGMFDFRKKNFIFNFIFGLTDYEMGIVPFQLFMLEYAREGRGVIQQRLHLTSEEKQAILQAISVNYEPANRVYRYNYFYDNCTTRARDILISHIEGTVEFHDKEVINQSYRDMIHQWNSNHRWARFGNDLLLGVKADSKLTQKQQQFLPDNLRRDFSYAKVAKTNAKKYALVEAETIILKANDANIQHQASVWDTVTPGILFAGILALVILLSLIDLKKKKTAWLLDVTLLTTSGLAGLILLAMVFSKHPTVNLNLQILLLNPLSIICAYSVANKQLKRQYSSYWTFLGACLIIFFIGGLFQQYAEGMFFLALTLLVRVCTNYKVAHQTNGRT